MNSDKQGQVLGKVGMVSNMGMGMDSGREEDVDVDAVAGSGVVAAVVTAENGSSIIACAAMRMRVKCNSGSSSSGSGGGSSSSSTVVDTCTGTGHGHGDGGGVGGGDSDYDGEGVDDCRDHDAELLYIAVAPQYRGGGKGTALLGYLLKHAHASGVRRLLAAASTPASNWLTERGFVGCDEQDDGHAHEQDQDQEQDESDSAKAIEHLVKEVNAFETSLLDEQQLFLHDAAPGLLERPQGNRQY
jgi:hypothetical protein